VATIIVSFAGDAELAIKTRDYLSEKAADGGASLLEDEIEVSGPDKKAVMSLLKSFVVQEKLVGYSITEFDNLFVVGIKADPATFVLLSCEYCGYQTPFGADLRNHRTPHMGYLLMPAFL
jgi:hypothetical protein